MATMKDPTTGQDIEVFTAAEVEAQKATALETYQKEHPDQSATLTETTAALEKAKADLTTATSGAGDDKDKNFGALRLAVKTAEEKADKAAADAMVEIEKIKNAPTEEYKGELVDRLAGKDATLKEKIEIHYKNLAGMPATNKNEVRARMEAAFKLAADQDAASILDGATGMGNRGNGGIPRNGDGPIESENGKVQRSVLGISDDVAKKYAPKIGQPGYIPNN